MLIPFSLTTAQATFEDIMIHILKDLLDQGVVVYIADILIETKMEEKDDLLVKEVLKSLEGNHLVISPEKCLWSSERVEFLGDVITPNRTEMAEDKIEAIKKWQLQRSLRPVQSFLGFANF
jgi:hypothetical protein